MREFVSLNIAVVAVGEAPTQVVVDRLGGAGHTIAQQAQLDDSVQIVRGKLLEHVADAGIDVVIVVTGLKTETAGSALQPLVTRPLTGFSDLLRMIAFQEIGSAAMLVDAEAAQCKSTFVFLLPANTAAIKLALDRLIVPQLDYRTKPRNVVMALPRIAHADSEADDAPAPDGPAPWITPRGPGEGPVPSMFPPRQSTQMPIARKSIQMASVAEVVEKTAASVSQRMPSAPTPALGVGVVSAHQSPPPVPPRITKTLPVPTVPHDPPPVPRAKVNTTLPTPVTNKAPAAPAKVVALSALLPEPVAEAPVISDPPPAAEAAPAAEVAHPAEVPAAAELAPAVEPEAAPPDGGGSVSDAVPTPVGEDVGSAPGDKAVNGAHVNGHVNGHASARKMISLAELEAEDRDAADEGVDEIDNDVAEIVDEPKRDEESRGMIVRAAGGSTPPSTTPYNETSGMMRSASPMAPPKDEPRGVIVGDEDEVPTAPARRVAAASTPPEDEPRRYAEPARRRDRKPLLLALIGILALGTVTVAGVIAVSRHDDRTAQAAPPDPAMPSPQEPIATTKDEPPAGEPPAANPAFGQTPAEAADGGVAAAEPVAVEPPPAEIDMGTPDPNARATTAGTVPKGPPRAPRPPKESIEKPAQDPADALANAPINKTEDGCDEVSCILDKYKQACCARFKPPEPEPVIEKPASGLPEKLDKLMVQEGISAVKPAVIACGENNGIHGTVKLQVRVSPSGKPLDVAVALTPDAALGTCVAGAVKLARFAETDEGGTFGYPFVF